jgi:hypothetical protein
MSIVHSGKLQDAIPHLGRATCKPVKCAGVLPETSGLGRGQIMIGPLLEQTSIRREDRSTIAPMPSSGPLSSSALQAPGKAELGPVR